MTRAPKHVGLKGDVAEVVIPQAAGRSPLPIQYVASRKSPTTCCALSACAAFASSKFRRPMRSSPMDPHAVWKGCGPATARPDLHQSHRPPKKTDAGPTGANK